MELFDADSDQLANIFWHFKTNILQIKSLVASTRRFNRIALQSSLITRSLWLGFVSSPSQRMAVTRRVEWPPYSENPLQTPVSHPHWKMF